MSENFRNNNNNSYNNNNNNSSEVSGYSAMGFKKPFVRRKRNCPLSGKNAPKIDYKDVNLLNKFTSERGKIIPARISSVSAKKQRKLSKAIKQARNLALMPYLAQ